MSPKEHLLALADAHGSVGLHLHDIYQLSLEGKAIPADKFTAARMEIARALAAANALELLAKGCPEPKHG